MTVWNKQGVLGNLNPPSRRCKGRLVNLYESKNLDFYITSIGEGNHIASSCHYEESAFDFKRQGVPKLDIIRVCGEDFDIVEYSDERDIFHCEYDPK